MTNSRFWALAMKEFHLLRKNRRLVIQLTIMPTVFVVLMGVALDPEVRDLRLGVADLSRTPESRDLIAAMSENRSFRLAGHYPSAEAVSAEISRRRLDLAVVIPTDYAELRARQTTAPVQVLVDAVNANTAAIAAGYLAQIFAQYNKDLAGGKGLPLAARVAVFYNPGLETSWFVVSGIMSILLLLNGSLAASGLVVREKELGTIEQLLMTPAGTLEIFLAKSVPLLVVLLADLAVALAVTRLAFGLPMRGSVGLLLLTATLASIAGIGMGILISAYCSRLQQAQILAFFINPPLVLISGAVSPVESMPRLFQQATLANPLFYLVRAMRAILLKGAGLDVLWPQLLTLAGFAVVLYGLAAWRFRRQLG